MLAAMAGRAESAGTGKAPESIAEDSMAQPKGKRVAEQVSGAQRDKIKAECDLPGSHLIRIRDDQEWERAFTAFLRVPAARVTFPGNVLGVTEQHIRVLKEEGIPFEYVSKAPNGEDAPV